MRPGKFPARGDTPTIVEPPARCRSAARPPRNSRSRRPTTGRTWPRQSRRRRRPEWLPLCKNAVSFYARVCNSIPPPSERSYGVRRVGVMAILLHTHGNQIQFRPPSGFVCRILQACLQRQHLFVFVAAPPAMPALRKACPSLLDS